MKQILFFLFSLFTVIAIAQPSVDYSVQVWAEVESSPPKITLNWLPVSGATKYIVYRKSKNVNSWGSSLTSFDENTTQFTDTTIVPGVSYDYRIWKLGNVAGFGYINAGIEIQAKHHRGNMILLVDSLFSDDLSFEVNRLIEDMIGDGWRVYRTDVNIENSVLEVKQIIDDTYNDSPDKLDLVFCLGHIPVPYSGNYAPDGHGNHVGAWPADGFYGDINHTWQDIGVNNTTASQERNHNVPGDGKFDYTKFPSSIELQVGRVDFSNMPAFALSELELLRQYLDKDHAYRTGQIDVEMKAVIDDNFGGFNGEAFAGSAWKSFAPLLNPENVKAGDYRSSMDTSSYMWSYGCGGGSYTSCNGIGNTNQFAEDSLLGIFSSMFGSYFGDWDSKNNILRAALAQGTILTNCWSGRPHWYFHHMGLGENIGYSTKQSMNNNGTTYNTPISFMSGMVSMGLMGDPTLRMHMIKPTSDFVGVFDGYDVILNWSASNDLELGYYIYRADDFNGSYYLLNDEPIYDSIFIDECIFSSGTYSYMVRSTKLEVTPSGSFYNLSQGVFADISADIVKPISGFESQINNDSLYLQNTSEYSENWLWDFGDGITNNDFEPIHIYETSGEYNVSLIASNLCFSDTISNNVSVVFTGINDLEKNTKISIFPNPGENWFTIESVKPMENAEISIYNSFGKSIDKIYWAKGEKSIRFSLEEQASGLYFTVISNGNNTVNLKFIKH